MKQTDWNGYPSSLNFEKGGGGQKFIIRLFDYDTYLNFLGDFTLGQDLRVGRQVG